MPGKLLNDLRACIFLVISVTVSPVIQAQVPEKNAIADTVWQKNGPFLSPPADTALWDRWRRELNEWRNYELKTYRDSSYRKTAFDWTASSYVSVFFLIHDRKFYNPEKGAYDVKGFMDYYTREYGKIDNVIMWQLSPNVGFDNRNQYDFFRAMPGGIPGLKKMVAEFHRYGVKVIVNNNPPFEGENIRYEMEPTGGRHYHYKGMVGYALADGPTLTDSSGGPVPMAKLVKQIDADGVFLNCWAYGGDGLSYELERVKDGVAVVGEWALDTRDLVEKQHMEWGFEYFGYPSLIKFALFPGAVMRNRWIERRHMIYMVDRRRKDVSKLLQMSWMNGAGTVVWEDIFGIWRGWNERDRAMLRTLSAVQRRYAGLFTGEGWTPMVKTEQPVLFASRWKKDGITLWTLMNHSATETQGRLLQIAHRPGYRYFDVLKGAELPVDPSGSTVLLQGVVNARGIAGFIALPAAAIDTGFLQFLESQAALHKRENLSVQYPALPVTRKAVISTRRYADPALPSGMAAFAVTDYLLEDSVPRRETGEYNNVDFLPNGGLNTAIQTHFNAFAIDTAPVTNAQFQRFMKTSGYKPRFSENFLKHWMNGRPPAGRENEAVVYVDIDDARAYARWAGKRLPTKEEWQYALESGKAGYGPKRVWEWNESEHTDGRTRFVMLKGGPGDWRVKGPVFYAPSGPQKTKVSAKYMLMWPGLDRVATIGFRCAADR